MSINNLLTEFLTQAQITNLTELDTTPELVDELVLIDKDDVTSGNLGTPKKNKV